MGKVLKANGQTFKVIDKGDGFVSLQSDKSLYCQTVLKSKMDFYIIDDGKKEKKKKEKKKEEIKKDESPLKDKSKKVEGFAQKILKKVRK